MIEQLPQFLATAVRLEADAQRGYSVLAVRMRQLGQAEVASTFERLGELSRLHLEETSRRLRAVTGPEPEHATSVIVWPDGDSPEDPLSRNAAAVASPRAALELALALERAACDYYSMIANQSRDPAVQELAQTFAEEESEHVDHLQRWLARIEPTIGLD